MDDCIIHPDVNSGMISISIPQQQDLLARAKDVFESMEPYARRLIKVRVLRSVETKGVKFSNKSILRISNRLRGSTINNLHVSELGEIAALNKTKAQEIMEGSMQAVPKTGRVVVESTAKGENLFSKLYRDGREELESIGWGIQKRGRPVSGGTDSSEISENLDGSPSEDEVIRGDFIYTVPKLSLPTKAFYPIFISWLEDDDCKEKIPTKNRGSNDALIKYEKYLKKHGLVLSEEQRNFWTTTHKDLGEGIHKEYPAVDEEAFYTSTEGTIYAAHYRQYAHINEKIENTITGKPVVLENGDLSDKEFHWNFKKDLPVYAAFDLGIVHPTFIIWFQINNKRLVILREASVTGETVEGWSKVLNKYQEYNYEKLILPHDADIRMKGEKPTTTKRIFVKAGWRCAISKSKSLKDVNLVREVIQHMYINRDVTPLLHEAMLNYRVEWDNVRDISKDKPMHDRQSHAADSLRYLVKEMYGKITGKEDYSDEVDLDDD